MILSLYRAFRPGFRPGQECRCKVRRLSRGRTPRIHLSLIWAMYISLCCWTERIWHLFRVQLRIGSRCRLMASDRWACGAIPHVVRYALRLGIAAILQVDSLSPTWATFLIHKQNRISHVDLLTTVAVLLLCGLDSVPNWLCPVAIRDTGAFLRMRVGDSCLRQFQSTDFLS